MIKRHRDLSSSLTKTAKQSGKAEVCKTFIHRFDSDRRLHSHQQLTSCSYLPNPSPVAENVTLFAKSGLFSSRSSLPGASSFHLARLFVLSLPGPAPALARSGAAA